MFDMMVCKRNIVATKWAMHKVKLCICMCRGGTCLKRGSTTTTMIEIFHGNRCHNNDKILILKAKPSAQKCLYAQFEYFCLLRDEVHNGLRRGGGFGSVKE